MSPTATNEQSLPSTQGEFHRAKRSAALFSVLAALGVTLLKLLTGLFTGSLGMLSEAAHSGVDLIAAGITLFSVHVSDRPADGAPIHFRTDISSSPSVLLAIARTYTRQHLHIPTLELADPIAAIVVACIILGITWKLARRTIDALTDATPLEVRAQNRQLIRE